MLGKCYVANIRLNLTPSDANGNSILNVYDQPSCRSKTSSEQLCECEFNVFRVRVNKIESIRDLDGNLGKRIELVEEREVSPYVLRPQSDEAKVAQDIMQALQQQMPFLPQRTQMSIPKILLFLTEQEYDNLGINFDVNQLYEVALKNQSIEFKKVL